MTRPEKLARQEENRAAHAVRGLRRLSAKIKAWQWAKALHDLDDLRVTLAKLAVEGQGGADADAKARADAFLAACEREERGGGAAEG